MSQDVTDDPRRFTSPAGELGMFDPADEQSNVAKSANPPTSKDKGMVQ